MVCCQNVLSSLPVFLWLFSLTGASVRERQVCQGPYCITLTDGAITAEAGLCVVIPCSFTTYYWFTPQHIVWYKCEPTKQRCGDSDVIFHTKKNNRKVQPGFTGRVSLLEPDVTLKNCSIIINDLKESDSGLYQLGVNGVVSGQADGFTYAQRATVSVHGMKRFNKYIQSIGVPMNCTDIFCVSTVWMGHKAMFGICRPLWATSRNCCSSYWLPHWNI